MNIKGFVCYDPEARRSIISRNVVFLEHISFYSLQSHFSVVDASYLPDFSAPSNDCKELQVYHRRPCPPSTTPGSDLPSQSDPPSHGILSPATTFASDLPSPPNTPSQGPLPPNPQPLRCSTRISKPIRRLSLIALFSTLEPMTVPPYSQAKDIPC